MKESIVTQSYAGIVDKTNNESSSEDENNENNDDDESNNDDNRPTDNLLSKKENKLGMQNKQRFTIIGHSILKRLNPVNIHLSAPVPIRNDVRNGSSAIFYQKDLVKIRGICVNLS